MLASNSPDSAAVELALLAGRAAILPNPSPLTYIVAATEPGVVNAAKQRPVGQEVAVWVHDNATWITLVPALNLSRTALGFALDLLRGELITLLVPVRPDTPPPAWTASALRDGHLLLFGARWQPLAPLLARFPRLYVSSANRTGCAPAATAAQAAAMFGPDIPVLDADALRTADTVPHAATTMLRISADAELTLVRHGAQDQAHGTDSAAYLERLRTTWLRSP
jgi:L-threonylcarbamoyladenylate synthase